jgi:RNA polymerase sigma-70 factor (ECF subfamily)
VYVLVDEAATEAQFDSAYRASWPSVYRFALAWTNDREEAMDAAQETYRRLWEMRARYDLSGDVTPLALTVERRLLADRWRRLVRRTRAIAQLLPTEHSWNPTSSDRWLDVQSAMSRLSALERVALLGLALEDRTSEDMASTLGISAGAVRAAASRGRSKLSREAQ